MATFRSQVRRPTPSTQQWANIILINVYEMPRNLSVLKRPTLGLTISFTAHTSKPQLYTGTVLSFLIFYKSNKFTSTVWICSVVIAQQMTRLSISAPGLGVYYFLSLPLSVCPSVRLSQTSLLLFDFSMKSSHFLAISSP